MTRQEAIKIIDCYDIGFYDLSGAKIPADKLADAFDMAIEALQQEPKRGRWVDKGDFYVCSECGKRMPYAVLGSEFSRAYAFMSDYCPHCGSAMEVESDEK